MKLIICKTYESVTLIDIAEAVGCVPSNLYYHFKSKQDLDVFNKAIEMGRLAPYYERISVELNKLNKIAAALIKDLS